MQYVSRKHIIVLMVIIFLVGVGLLLGEKFSSVPGFSRTSVPATPVGIEEESMLYGSGESQSQLSLKSESFVIRPGQSRLSYDEALSLYKNSTLQFSEDCQLASSSRSYRLNNEVMIDNRSSKPNTFSIGSASIVLGPYDFGFLILKEKGMSIPVNCDERKNVATLSVQ
jgi:hypothetical protein